ncbi:MAG: aminodeoxychorismate synthase component I [Prosthecochloris sp.]|nr:aminodeoxychorismate synthase component I [Prosthecochloris sp.]
MSSFTASEQNLQPGSAWFGGAFSGGPSGGGLVFEDPVETLELRSSSDVEAFFSGLQERHDAGFALAGYVGYEAGYGFEPEVFRQVESAGGDEELPLAWFGVYRSYRRTVSEPGVSALAGVPPLPVLPEFDLSPGRYREDIAAIHAAIAAGDVYQVNFTGRFSWREERDPAVLFQQLSSRQPDAYRAWLRPGMADVLSFSPELFFTVENQRIEVRPMKGTAPRGQSSREDRELSESLRTCSKNRAENLMIVDLLRNDLGRICVRGSVQVPELFVIETHPTLHQMISHITGRLSSSTTLQSLFRALFPCGSVTGAPKLSAMRLIRDLEHAPRGIYTGGVGFILPEGRMQFNVAIRTLILSRKNAEYGAGSGIVWDSGAEAEYAECHLKASFLLDRQDTDGVQLFETMLWNGRYVWKEEHLRRLASSALALGYRCDGGFLAGLLDQHERQVLRLRGGRSRVRLALSSDGTASVTSEPLSLDASRSPVRVCFAAECVRSDDPWLRHKTTRRMLYDRLFAAAAGEGYDEVLFCNERHEVCEGAISSVVIMREGRFLTPPLSSGLLPGVYRSYFQRTRPNVEERVLSIDDLLRADAVFICNSVRGLRRAMVDRRLI